LNQRDLPTTPKERTEFHCWEASVTNWWNVHQKLPLLEQVLYPSKMYELYLPLTLAMVITLHSQKYRGQTPTSLTPETLGLSLQKKWTSQ
jgi:hypothetical protein